MSATPRKQARKKTYETFSFFSSGGTYARIGKRRTYCYFTSRIPRLFNVGRYYIKFGRLVNMEKNRKFVGAKDFSPLPF
ncbi:MAG: hypothetical protein CVU77_03930 [Elusimicrobia bacterium HGW-Elusimicrobia-1]|nr:MAG: hypothetical protein CVU77_03930 [Elusimicrobia bacterium HGW-Elusimicrobia-1]